MIESSGLTPSLLPLLALAAVALPVAWDIESAWKDYCFKLSDPFMKYFTDMVMGHNCLGIWRAASLADPLNMHRTAITPAYLRATVAPLLNKLVKPALVCLHLPTSACVERAFSILKYIMGDQQVSSLIDKIDASLMLRYNRGLNK